MRQELVRSSRRQNAEEIRTTIKILNLNCTAAFESTFDFILPISRVHAPVASCVHCRNAMLAFFSVDVYF